MAPSKDRQRMLARAKRERQIARRAVRERRRRRITAGVGTVAAVALIAAGSAWFGGAFDGDEKTDPLASDVCAWTPQNASGSPELKDVGTPPTKDLPLAGTETMTIATDKGAPITATLDVARSVCGVASMSYLAGKKFFDNTECHELTTEGALLCGDPSGTGMGGPTYTFYGENVPTAPEPSASAAPKTPLYPKGTVALAGPAGQNGSRFLIFFKDFTPKAAPEYSILGKVTGGLDTLTTISKIPTVENSAGAKVKPKEKITIKSLTVGVAASAAPSSGAQS